MKKFLKALVTVGVLVAVFIFSMPFLMRALYPLKYGDFIEKHSEKYNLDQYLVMGVISAESRFSENAVSHKSAKGLMQLKDETASWCAEKFGIEGEFYLPEVNIEIGCAYLRYLLDLFDGNIENALAAYNAGQGRVIKWLEDKSYSDDGEKLHTIPYDETREYVNRVQKRADIYKKLYDK